jgi:hypothetical protein
MLLGKILVMRRVGYPLTQNNRRIKITMKIALNKKTNAVILKQQTRIEQLKTQISELKKLTNKLIKKNK